MRDACYIILFYMLLLGSACSYEKGTVDWEEIQVSSEDVDWNALYFLDENEGYVVGGNNWERGMVAYTSDGGEDWEIKEFDSATKKTILAHDNRVFSVGLSDSLHWKATSTATWNAHQFFEWKTYNDMTTYDGSAYFLCGGGAFRTGYITKLNADFGVDTIIEFPFELDCISFAGENTVIAAGYGAVYRSDDRGTTWKYELVVDDYYKDIFFVDGKIGYLIGGTGSILKTIDAGLTWQVLRDSDGFTRNFEFEACHFINEDEGFIAGKGGILWHTKNGGISWTRVQNLPHIHFMDIQVYGNVGYLSSGGGKIVKFLFF